MLALLVCLFAVLPQPARAGQSASDNCPGCHAGDNSDSGQGSPKLPNTTAIVNRLTPPDSLATVPVPIENLAGKNASATACNSVTPDDVIREVRNQLGITDRIRGEIQKMGAPDLVISADDLKSACLQAVKSRKPFKYKLPAKDLDKIKTLVKESGDAIRMASQKANDRAAGMPVDNSGVMPTESRKFDLPKNFASKDPEELTRLIFKESGLKDSQIDSLYKKYGEFSISYKDILKGFSSEYGTDRYVTTDPKTGKASVSIVAPKGFWDMWTSEANSTASSNSSGSPAGLTIIPIPTANLVTRPELIRAITGPMPTAGELCGSLTQKDVLREVHRSLGMTNQIQDELAKMGAPDVGILYPDVKSACVDAVAAHRPYYFYLQGKDLQNIQQLIAIARHNVLVPNSFALTDGVSDSQAEPRQFHLPTDYKTADTDETIKFIFRQLGMTGDEIDRLEGTSDFAKAVSNLRGEISNIKAQSPGSVKHLAYEPETDGPLINLKVAHGQWAAWARSAKIDTLNQKTDRAKRLSDKHCDFYCRQLLDGAIVTSYKWKEFGKDFSKPASQWTADDVSKASEMAQKFSPLPGECSGTSQKDAADSENAPKVSDAPTEIREAILNPKCLPYFMMSESDTLAVMAALTLSGNAIAADAAEAAAIPTLAADEIITAPLSSAPTALESVATRAFISRAAPSWIVAGPYFGTKAEIGVYKHVYDMTGDKKKATDAARVAGLANYALIASTFHHDYFASPERAAWARIAGKTLTPAFDMWVMTVTNNFVSKGYSGEKLDNLTDGALDAMIFGYALGIPGALSEVSANRAMAREVERQGRFTSAGDHWLSAAKPDDILYVDGDTVEFQKKLADGKVLVKTKGKRSITVDSDDISWTRQKSVEPTPHKAGSVLVKRLNDGQMFKAGDQVRINGDAQGAGAPAKVVSTKNDGELVVRTKSGKLQNVNQDNVVWDETAKNKPEDWKAIQDFLRNKNKTGLSAKDRENVLIALKAHSTPEADALRAKLIAEAPAGSQPAHVADSDTTTAQLKTTMMEASAKASAMDQLSPDDADLVEQALNAMEASERGDVEKSLLQRLKEAPGNTIAAIKKIILSCPKDAGG